MLIYYCWLTVLIPEYLDGIISGLVKRGYMVGSAAQSGKPTIPPVENSPAALIALSLYMSRPPTDAKPDAKFDANTIYADVRAVLGEMSAKVFSVVIVAAGDAAWTGSNFSIPGVEKALPEPPPVKKTDPNMN